MAARHGILAMLSARSFASGSRKASPGPRRSPDCIKPNKGCWARRVPVHLCNGSLQSDPDTQITLDRYVRPLNLPKPTDQTDPNPTDPNPNATHRDRPSAGEHL